jgi:carboxylate-amine ligase
MSRCATAERFDATPAGTVGLEEELLLVDDRCWAPADRAVEVAGAVDDARVKPELPACQIEIATGVHTEIWRAVEELAGWRARIAAACPAGVVPVAAAVHPTATEPMVLSRAARSAGLLGDYREPIRTQLVGSLQVHVAVGGADRTLAVYNALRSVLPELAAVSAAAPFLGGRDTGLCSVRPVLATQLPRQGVPPAIRSWQGWEHDLQWIRPAGGMPAASVWWWELRPHIGYGTLELRVMDVQPDLARTGALAALAHATVADLAARYDAGERWEPVDSWKIAENRWSALRDGLDGHLLDVVTGEPVPTRTRLHRLIDLVEPHAPAGLDGARHAVEHTTAACLRGVGLDGVLPWLADRFLA